MKIHIPFLLFLMLPCWTDAQTFQFRLNAGLNMATIADYPVGFLVAEDATIPGDISLVNFQDIERAYAPTFTRTQPGWMLEGELLINLHERWGLAAMAGINQARYIVSTRLDVHPGDINRSESVQLETEFPEYAHTGITYLSLAPVSVFYHFLADNALSLQLAPVLSIPVYAKPNVLKNILVSYQESGSGSMTTREVDRVYFEFGRRFNEVLLGGQARLDAKLRGNLSCFINVRLYLESVFEFDGEVLEQGQLSPQNLSVFQTGISITL